MSFLRAQKSDFPLSQRLLQICLVAGGQENRKVLGGVRFLFISPLFSLVNLRLNSKIISSIFQITTMSFGETNCLQPLIDLFGGGKEKEKCWSCSSLIFIHLFLNFRWTVDQQNNLFNLLNYHCFLFCIHVVFNL